MKWHLLFSELLEAVLQGREWRNFVILMGGKMGCEGIWIISGKMERELWGIKLHFKPSRCFYGLSQCFVRGRERCMGCWAVKGCWYHSITPYLCALYANNDQQLHIEREDSMFGRPCIVHGLEKQAVHTSPHYQGTDYCKNTQVCKILHVHRIFHPLVTFAPLHYNCYRCSCTNASSINPM